jgi:hypothetical protein
MKKLICLLAIAALFGACEKTEIITPATPTPSAAQIPDGNTDGRRIKRSPGAPDAVAPVATDTVITASPTP